MSWSFPLWIFRILLLLVLGGMHSVAWADYALNMTKGATFVSKEVYNLHMTIFWVCVAIGLVVFSVMFYAIIRHRKSLGHEPAQFHDHALVEIIWSVIPFIILILMAIPATKLLFKMHDAADSDITIKVTGYQWRWQYEYLGEGLQFMSSIKTSQDQIHNRDVKDPHYLLDVDNPLVIPIGKKVRFLLTSNDVIHSWWVPDLGFKKDTIPGFINEAWAKVEKPGTFRGQCAELCGVNHAFMPIVVKAVTEEEFQAWLAEKKGLGTKESEAPTASEPAKASEPQAAGGHGSEDSSEQTKSDSPIQKGTEGKETEGKGTEGDAGVKDEVVKQPTEKGDKS